MKKGSFVIMLLFFMQIAFTQSAIHVEKRGEGDPIIFLPGFTSPGSVWNETVRILRIILKVTLFLMPDSMTSNP